MIKKRILAVLSIVLIIFCTLPLYSSAIALPDSAPAINAVYAYDLTDGGVGVLVDYTLDYATVPNETATQSYLAVFVDTDGATQLKSVAPFTFVDNGYGRGLVWIPFTPAEVASFGIDSSLSASYRIWLIGNPGLTWTPTDVPPKTISTIDSWQTTGDPKVILALRVLAYAAELETAWTLDIIETTTLGQKLTANGEAYFINVIADVRNLAPAAFATEQSIPAMQPIDYTMVFGATATSSVLAGSPLTLTQGSQTLNPTGAGTIVFTLTQGTAGNVTGATVTNSPVDIVAGNNTVTITGAGAITVNVLPMSAAYLLEASVNGTGMDTQGGATAFGFSRNMFSGLAWLAITIIFCAGVYKKSQQEDYTGGSGRAVLLVFIVMSIGGALLGMFSMTIVAIVFMACGGLIGYVVFFRNQADIGRTVMFMVWMFIVVGIAANTMQGQLDFARTRLTADISATADTITVSSTTGFPGVGIVEINGERIAYAHKTATTFEGSGLLGTVNPLVRGTGGTTAIAHTTGEQVATIQGAMLNTAMNYNLAVIADPTGLMAFVSVPKAFLSLLGSFLFLPLQFLGTDLQILTIFWAVIGIGLLISITAALVTGRRI